MKNFKYVISLLIFFTFYLSTYAQNDQKLVLSKGTVTDSQSGKPLLAVDIEFTDAQGNKKRTKSNEITGKFEQLLNANETYKVLLMDDKVLREYQEIQTKGLEKYSEQNIDLIGKSLLVGMQIKSGNLFETSSTNLSETGSKFFEDLKSIMRFNRSISIEINVNSKDTYSSANKDEDKLKKLVVGRVSSIEVMVMKWGGLKSKVKMKHNFEIEKTSKEKSDDVMVTITLVEPIK